MQIVPSGAALAASRHAAAGAYSDQFWALGSLESAGLVTTRPGRGAVVTSLDPGGLAAVAAVRGSRRAFPGRGRLG